SGAVVAEGPAAEAAVATAEAEEKAAAPAPQIEPAAPASPAGGRTELPDVSEYAPPAPPARGAAAATAEAAGPAVAVRPEAEEAAREDRAGVRHEPEAETAEKPAPATEAAAGRTGSVQAAAGPEPGAAATAETGKKEEQSRYGVVIPADVAEKLHGPTPPKRRGHAAAVSRAPVDAFEPVVTYPKLREELRGEEEEEEGRPGRRRKGRRPLRERDREVPARAGERPKKARRAQPAQPAQPVVVKREGPIEVESPVTIRSLSQAIGIRGSEILKKLLEGGRVANINDILSDEDAQLIALEFKQEITIRKPKDIEEELLREAGEAARKESPEERVPRAPIVTVMGHVDHGKTSLLDYIRNARVAAGESGGITQHIGAYLYEKGNIRLVFIDTPGHEAFTEMRSRGAQVTDLIVLVVAADDGVMPQTGEAINHAMAAKVPIVVAVNKIDKPGADPQKVMRQLSEKGIHPEEWGGQVGVIPCSAITGQGVDALLERLRLEAEILDLRANPNKKAVGTVLEANLSEGRGVATTVLVQDGTLRRGDIVLCGSAYGRVRQIYDDQGRLLDSAGPSMPVAITGLSEVPDAGDKLIVMEDMDRAREIAERRKMIARQASMAQKRLVTLETLHEMLSKGDVAALRLVLKVDVRGSLAPIEKAVKELATDEVRVEILHSGVGNINESDVLLAEASQAIVLGFNVSPDPNARAIAEMKGVDIRTYDVIYALVEDVKAGLEGLLKPELREVVQGRAEVRKIFSLKKAGTVAGCFVADGLVSRGGQARLLRGGKTIWTGRIASLRREKDDVREVKQGFECGIRLEGFDDVQPGDIIEAFVVEKLARSLDGTVRKK
ncbi:MAG: translation initiation factor IF-2, partial [Planctomycetota bacterium]|nr:translation initiation factor IF-2 [Planctomycetota bacterium]